MKDSNQARLEILKDILSKHLDMDCNNDLQDVTYTPAYFLGRHDVSYSKTKLIKEFYCENKKLHQICCVLVQIEIIKRMR